MHPQIAPPASQARRIPASVPAIAGIITAVVFIALLIDAARRRPWNDEAMFANPAEKRFLGITVYEGDGLLPELNRYTYLIFPLNLVTLAGWYKLVGFSLYRFIANRMSGYDLVYDYNSYRISRRKDSLL